MCVFGLCVWQTGGHSTSPILRGVSVGSNLPSHQHNTFPNFENFGGGLLYNLLAGWGLDSKTEIIKFVIFTEDVLYLLETNKEMIVQRLKKGLQNDTEVSYRYYSVLSALNDLELTDREIQLMSFIAVSGSISVPSNREKFCTTYKTTGATVNNMVSKLKKRNLLFKKDGKIVVNPLISLDFSSDITLEIKILHEGKA
jgi:hypothetical protein